MNRYIGKATLAYIFVMYSIPSQAMLSRFAPALSRRLLTSGSHFTSIPPIESHLQPGSGLLARALATQHTHRSSDRNYQEDDSQSGQYNWWQQWRSRFARNEAMTVSVAFLLNWHPWWTEDDICNKPEDFNNPEKLQRTKECFATGNKNLVFDTFVRNFNDLKKSPKALERVLEFFCTTFDYFKYSKMSTLELLVLENFDIFKANKFGKQLIQKIEREDDHFREKLDIFKLFTRSKSQSAGLFRTLSYKLEKLEGFYSTDLGYKGCTNIIKQVLELEQQEETKGNYTFVHAYDWQVHFYQDLDTHLRAALYGTPTDSLSLRFIKQPNIKTKDGSVTKRKKIMETGASYYYTFEGLQKNMIFMTCGILTISLDLIAGNRSINTPGSMLQKIFDSLCLNEFLRPYRKEIEELQTLHEKASNFGAGILFSFSPEMLKKSVFVCRPGGVKRKVLIHGIGETEDVQLILDTLRTAPELIKDLHLLEFVFVVTKDCGLNPQVVKNNGIKAIPFNAADPAAYALYEQKRDKLMAKIKAALKTKQAKLNKKQKLEHLNMLKHMNEWFANYNCLNDCKQWQRVQEA